MEIKISRFRIYIYINSKDKKKIEGINLEILN